jgi:hypothetical protein
MTEESQPAMHCDAEPQADPVQAEAQVCPNCQALYVPRTRWQAFCRARCRNEYHAHVGASGTVASVRRINRGASIVVHLEGPAAEAALKLTLKAKVRVVP